MEIGHGQGGTGGTETPVAGRGNSGGTSAEGGGSPSGGSSSSAGDSGSEVDEHSGGPIPPLGAQREAGKLDLLLAIDNSLSMAGKQALLAHALPELIERLINPPCVDDAGNVVASPVTPVATCPAGSQRETEPLRDLHIGAVTSSLGSHGANGENDACTRAPEEDDRARLLPTVRDGLPSYDSNGYLKWDPDGRANPPGEGDVQALVDAVRLTVERAGEEGCGLEAQLESVYRFLVDPEPHESLERSVQSALVSKVGVDEVLLQQRAAFLRPDSSVVVLMLTDENDCSVVDEGYGWLTARASVGGIGAMYRATSQCQTNPNDACCQSCGEAVTKDGCPPISEDEECQKGKMLANEDDSINLRCFEQKRRFGFDLLYPIGRYVSGFGGGKVRARSGELVDNPLFIRDNQARDPSLFTFAVIGGVPWQDLATTASQGGPTLELLTAAQLEAQNRWPLIIGDVAANVPSLDPFMRESVAARTGMNPLTGDETVPPSSQDPSANAINGHEHDTLGIELQYACTFDLAEPIECDEATASAGAGCDCFAEDLAANRAVCNPPGGGAATTTQYRGKAYPSLRELRVARELGRRTALSSVCSRNTTDDTRSDYGYRPALSALGRRIAETLEKP